MTTWVFRLTFPSILGLVLDLDLAFVLVGYSNTDPCQLWSGLQELCPLHTLLAQSSLHRG